jgi:uncharacterized membrane protein YphA (DoxX/SURF4 family)
MAASSAATGRRHTRAAAALRIAFGVVWAVDAWFKWQPSFTNRIVNYLNSARTGQPAVIKDWIGLWANIIKVNPTLFAHMIALGETAVALGLILGLFSNLTYIVGAALAMGIWTTAEGLGGPYGPGSTDIGAAIIYVFVMAGLWTAHAGATWSIDRRLHNHLGRWRLLTTHQPALAER